MYNTGMFDIKYMQLAFEQAEIAFMQKEVPVGAVIISKEREILAIAHNTTEENSDIRNHAELNAIGIACKKIGGKFLTSTSLYITLEPCFMCIAAISMARIDNIFYSCHNKKFGAISNTNNFFTANPFYYKPNIYSNIMDEEGKILMQKWIII